MFAFGDGKVARNASIFGSIPMHIINALKCKGKDQALYLCFVVVGRSKIEFTPWEKMEIKYSSTLSTLFPRYLRK
jgi:hypothetical protein